MSEDTQRIEIIELEMDTEEGMLFAWGIHDPAAFVEACAVYGVESDDASRVRHERYIESKRRSGPFDRWFEPVVGEPNATVLAPA